jgi:hypothetical protein
MTENWITVTVDVFVEYSSNIQTFDKLLDQWVWTETVDFQRTPSS